MKDALEEFDRVLGGLEELLKDEDQDIFIPVLTCYLAAWGPMSGKDRAEFRQFVCSTIDRSYTEYKTRKRQ